MSLVVPPNFQHILRVLNTNIEGKTSVMFALTSIKGIGRRYANIVLKKADIPLTKRAGELTEDDTEKLITIMQVSFRLLGSNHNQHNCASCGAAVVRLWETSQAQRATLATLAWLVGSSLAHLSRASPELSSIRPLLIILPQNPRQYKIPDWFLNRQRDIKDGKTNQVGTST